MLCSCIINMCLTLEQCRVGLEFRVSQKPAYSWRSSMFEVLHPHSQPTTGRALCSYTASRGSKPVLFKGPLLLVL